MKVFITGGLGFVGRHFAKRLLDDGHTVAIVDDLSSGTELHDWMFKPNGWDEKTRSIPNLQLMISDCRAWFRAAGPGSLWSADKFDLIIHCAAIVGGRIKIEEDPLRVATDLAIDSEFFMWLADCKATRTKVIYFSSSAVYPLELQTRERHLPLSESFVNFNSTRWAKPDLTYGFVKLAGEYLAKFAAEKYGLDVVIYRPFGGYGTDQHSTYPFSAIIRRVLADNNPVVVWGSGEQKRDFIHVDDVVGCVLQTNSKLSPGEAMNIGSGIPTSFFELATLVAKLAGKDVSVINDVNRPEGVFSRVSDPFQMERLYKLKVSLAEGIERALKRNDRT
jgi:nucleoside-diphosphate-sugar epimerase